MLLWVTTIPQKLGSLLKQGMEKYRKRSNKCCILGKQSLWAGKGGSKKALLKANEWLREPEVKLSGNVFKANKAKKQLHK